MRFLLLNQTFHPDVMATGQYLAEAARALVERGHEVTVVTSRRAYDHPEKEFPKQETWRGIRIIRVGSTALGKASRWRRAVDFASFLISCSLRVLFLHRHDAVVALTSPPLISFLGAVVSKLRHSRFYYWVMDFNPDEAIAAGWLRADSPAARLLDWMSRFSLRRATRIIALDRFMRDRIVAKGISPDKILVLPPWSQDTQVRFDPEGRARFRKLHGLEGKFVVMYSGNHSPCHPLDTLLEAAHRLADDPGIVFCFVGGGSEWRKIQAEDGGPAFAQKLRPGKQPRKLSGCKTAPNAFGVQDGGRRADSGGHSISNFQPSTFNTQLNSQRSTLNLTCLPYQPLNELSGSLSAADLHVVVMGDPFLGLVHPCKIYNILGVGAPVLYIGPSPSHVTEIFEGEGAANGDGGPAFAQKLRPGRQRTADRQSLRSYGPAGSPESFRGAGQRTKGGDEVSIINSRPSFKLGSARHGEVEKVVEIIERMRAEADNVDREAIRRLSQGYSTGSLLPRLIATLEGGEVAGGRHQGDP